MEPNLQVVTGRQKADAALPLGASPAAGLRAMLRRCGQEDLRAGVVHVHEVVLIEHRKRFHSDRYRMHRAGFDGNRALGWMASEDTTQQSTQHGCSGVLRRAGMDCEQS